MHCLRRFARFDLLDRLCGSAAAAVGAGRLDATAMETRMAAQLLEWDFLADAYTVRGTLCLAFRLLSFI